MAVERIRTAVEGICERSEYYCPECPINVPCSKISGSRMPSAMYDSELQKIYEYAKELSGDLDKAIKEMES